MKRENRRKSTKRKSCDAEKRPRKSSTSVSDINPSVETPLEEENLHTDGNHQNSCSDDERLQIVEADESLTIYSPSLAEEKEVSASPDIETEPQQNGVNNKSNVDDSEENNDLTINNNDDEEIRSTAVENSSPIEPVSVSDEDNSKKDELQEDHEKKLANAASEAAARFYSSLNQLTLQAFMNVKREPTADTPLAEKCMQNILATLNGGFYGTDVDHGQATGNRASSNDIARSSVSFASSRTANMLRPPTELSPDTFAKQLRHNDSASMVVCRTNAVKNMIDSPDTPSSSGRGGSTGSGQGTGGGSSLHQFVTRYTIERPDNSNASGIEICLEGNDLSDPVVEVECGGNKGLLYVTKLCQGSKGQSIFFNDEWLTPNEFQFISGRETAKDWKRSIRHCGKSLKTLMSKGILQVHPPVCECDYCKGHGPAIVEKVSKKRTMGISIDRPITYENAARSVGSSTPSSTEFTAPHSGGAIDSPGIAFHKPGREGGLSSIISQLHNKKAISGNDIMTGSGEESLDLSVRTPSRTSPGCFNGRKRQRETGARRPGSNREEDLHLPMKRRHSNEEENIEPFPISAEESDASLRRASKNISQPLCLTSNKDKQEKERFYSTSSSKGENKSNSEDCNGTFDSNRDERSNRTNSGRKNGPNMNPPPSNNQGPTDYSGAFRSSLPYNDYDLLDAMKRAFANVYSRGSQTPPPQRLSSSTSPHPNRGGFINLDSTSSRCDRGSSHSSVKDQPMVELISPHRKVNGSRFGDPYEYNRHRNPYDANNFGPHKAPITVLHHHPNQYENPLLPGHRQSSSNNAQNYYPMPPPLSHGYGSDRRYNSKSHRRGYPNVTPQRLDRRNRLLKGMNRKSAPTDGQRRPLGDGTHSGEHQMLDLHNHAIPMLSLTYSKKKATIKPDEKEQCNGMRNTDSSPPSFPRDASGRSRTAASDDEITRKGDNMQRLSASAPPPPFTNGNAENGLDGNNNNLVKSKDGKDDVFQCNRPRAKSASPNATRSHPYFDGSGGQRSTSSVDVPRPDSNVSCFQDSPFESPTTVQQQYEILRWREITSAMDDMGEWSLDGVSEFLSNIGCGQYKEVFRENGIDGDALPLLLEHHLVEKMGMKLGHALKLMSRVHRRLGNHCALLSDRMTMSRIPHYSIDFYRKIMRSSENSNVSTPNENGDLPTEGQSDDKSQG